jgi:hypothetical protein
MPPDSPVALSDDEFDRLVEFLDRLPSRAAKRASIDEGADCDHRRGSDGRPRVRVRSSLSRTPTPAQFRARIRVRVERSDDYAALIEEAFDDLAADPNVGRARRISTHEPGFYRLTTPPCRPW